MTQREPTPSERQLMMASKPELREMVRGYRFLLLSLGVSDEAVAKVDADAVEAVRKGRVAA